MPEETIEGADASTTVIETEPLDFGAADVIAERDAERSEETEHGDEAKEAGDPSEEPEDEKAEDDDPDKIEDPEADEDEDGKEDGEEGKEQGESDKPGGEKAFDESDVVGSALKALAEAGHEQLADRFGREMEEVSGIVNAVDRVWASPENAQQDLPAFLKQLSQHHGLSVAELLGDDLVESLNEPAFLSPMEKHLYDEVKNLKAMQAKELERAAKDKSDAEFKGYIREATPRVQSALEKRYDGWKPTEEQVEEALREFPQFRDKPTRAVEAKYTRQISRHMARQAASVRGKSVPEMDRSRDVGGVAIPDDPLEFTAEHALRMRD